MFWYVYLAFIQDVLFSCIFLCFIWTFNAYDITKVMTNGGPGMSTQVLNTTIYSYFGSGAMSTGCAANVMLTILVIIFFWAINRIFSAVEGKLS